jgi:hypothetical protein
MHPSILITRDMHEFIRDSSEAHPISWVKAQKILQGMILVPRNTHNHNIHVDCLLDENDTLAIYHMLVVVVETSRM